MFLTSEGAMLALALAGLVCGLLGAWILLRSVTRQVDTEQASRPIVRASQVRRRVAPTERSPRV